MIEKITTSLEISKKLKKLGILQESLFYWINRYGDYLDSCDEWEIIDASSYGTVIERYITTINDSIVSAFTVTELGNSLKEIDVESIPTSWIDSLHSYNPDEVGKEVIFIVEKWDDALITINETIQKFRKK